MPGVLIGLTFAYYLNKLMTIMKSFLYVLKTIIISTILTVPALNQDKNIVGSTFIGGSDIDEPYELSVVQNKIGDIYISGFTLSKDFPTTQDVFSSKFIGGSSDRFISKISNDLSELLSSTYIGGKGLASPFISGNGDDLGHAIAVDSEGNIYIAGYTESPDFPVVKGSYDESYNGGRDVYVAKFDKNLKNLMASTFLGGSGNEGYMWPRISLTIDNENNVYITGLTHSVDFPMLESSYDSSFNGGEKSGDIFVAKMDKNLKHLLASTYIGGNKNEWRISILTYNNDVFICGETESADFPVKNGYDLKLNTIKDIFISKFNNDLLELKASTFFGGSKLDEALSMKISGNGEIVLTGYTESMDFPTTDGAFRQQWSGGDREAYVAIFDNSLKKLKACTFLGGSARDMGRDLALDEQSMIYVTGNTNSADFPVTINNQGQKIENQMDSFFSILSPKLDKLLWSVSFGGGKNDIPHSIIIDKNKNAILAGTTSSEDFPTTNNAFDVKYNGGTYDCFLVKFSRIK